MRKTIIALFITAASLIFSSSVACADNDNLGFLTFDKENGTITKCDDTIKGALEIPAEIDGVPVASIGRYAFDRCLDLTSVDIPDSVTIIGPAAFSGCKELKSIRLPEGLERMNDNIFEDCSGLTDINIPNSVTYIGRRSFKGCQSLTEIKIPDSVTILDDYAFSYCYGLKNVTLPKNLDNINNSLFSHTPITNITIPDSVKAIGEGAFSYCAHLENIVIPQSVTAINDWAFEYSGLKEINIPDSVKYIGKYAFENCGSIEKVYIGNDVTSVSDYAFHNCESLKRVKIGSSVSTIGSNSFAACTKLEEVDLGTNLKTIHDDAFSRCLSLLDIDIPDSVEQIGKYCFHDCTALRRVRIGGGTKKIDDYAFGGCENLTVAEIPSSVTYFGAGTFYGCDSLSDVYYTGSKEQLDNTYCTLVKVTDEWDNAKIHYNSEMPIEIKITLDGERVMCDVPPFISHDRTLVPVRAIFEALGMTVLWNGETGEILAKGENSIIAMQVGNDMLKYGKEAENLKKLTMDIEPIISNGRTFVPARYAAEATGCVVDWDNLTKTVKIISSFPEIPLYGRQYYVIYREGYRDNRIELAVFDITSTVDALEWDGHVLGDVNKDGSYVNDIKYYLTDDGWVQFEQGYERVSNNATEILDSNIDIINTAG